MKNFYLDLREVVANLVVDLRRSNLIVDATTKRTLAEIEEGTETYKEVMTKIVQLAPEYVWYRLTGSYFSLPEAMSGLFERLCYELQYLPDSAAPFELSVEDVQSALTDTDNWFNETLEYFPDNPWTMVEVGINNNLMAITFGPDLRVHLFEQQYGKSRWKGEPVAMPCDKKAKVYASLNHPLG